MCLTVQNMGIISIAVTKEEYMEETYIRLNPKNCVK